MSVDHSPQASSPWLASEPVSFRGPLPTRPPYSLELNYQTGRFPKVSSPSLWTHGPQLRLLSFACPRAPHQTPRVQRGLGCARPGSEEPSLGPLWLPHCLCLSFAPYPGHHEPKLPSRGIHSEPNLGKGQRPSRPVAPRGRRGRPELWARWATGLGPAMQPPRPPHPSLLHSSSFTTLFSVVGPASSAPNSDTCCD